MERELHRGDIFFIKNSTRKDVVGCEQMANRPGIIVSNNRNNQHSGAIEVVYLTTKPKVHLPTHVLIRSAKRPSIALCEQIHTVSTERLESFVGQLSEEEMRAVNMALLVSLQLNLFENCG